MSESTLPYLKEIADSVKKLNSDGNRKQSEALQNINKTIGTYNVKNESLIIGGNENTEAIAEAVKTGLVEEVIEGEGSQAHPVEKSVFDVMKEAFVQVFREAMFTVVGEASQAHEESIFKVMKDEVVSSVRDSLNKTVQDGSSTVEMNVPAAILALKADLDDIRTAQQAIASALAGSGGTGLSAQIAQIVTNTAKISDVKDAIIDPTTQVNKIDQMTSAVNDVKNAVIDPNGQVNLIAQTASDVNTIKNAVYDESNQVSYVEQISSMAVGINRGLVSPYGVYTVDEVMSINGKLS